MDALFLRSEGGGSILGRFPAEFDSADNLLWRNSKLGPFLFRMVRHSMCPFSHQKKYVQVGTTPSLYIQEIGLVYIHV